MVVSKDSLAHRKRNLHFSKAQPATTTFKCSTILTKTSTAFHRMSAFHYSGGPNHNTQGSLITTQKAMQLRKAVFPGTLTGGEESRARMTFSEEWKGKGFCFNVAQQDLAYGLVQVKGGPCGLFAAVQAYVLKYLLFVDSAHSLRLSVQPMVARAACRRSSR
ncbi:hypothetical protein BJ741DRAFT_350355 [Chytriomyces cf. hyalinus JEL632]|nr:hypothetical protein BJ741DRAFT_350355 [Chytriomyces cf. hyalinus JEL632]